MDIFSGDLVTTKGHPAYKNPVINQTGGPLDDLTLFSDCRPLVILLDLPEYLRLGT